MDIRHMNCYTLIIFQEKLYNNYNIINTDGSAYALPFLFFPIMLYNVYIKEEKEQKMIKGIIFDMDGTLIDTNDLVIDCIKKTVNKYLGYIPEKDSFNEILGKPLDIQMSFFSEEHTTEMVDYYRKIYLERRDEDTKIFPGIMELLKALNESKMKMAIVSNKGRRGINHGLEMFNMKDFFEITLSVVDVENKKPHPEAINKVLQIWNMRKEEVLFVGDSHNDILAANNAGVKSVLVGWSILPKEQFENLKIDYIIDKPMEIIMVI